MSPVPNGENSYEKLIALNEGPCSRCGRIIVRNVYSAVATVIAVGVDLAAKRGGRKTPELVVIGVQGQPNLLEVVFALDAPGCLTRRLHCGEQQPDEDRDDRDHDQEFDQRETAMNITHGVNPFLKSFPQAGELPASSELSEDAQDILQPAAEMHVRCRNLPGRARRHA